MDLWVFAYGSLMWRPNFRFSERVHARLDGAHRALCVYSVVHRGVHRAPGLVLGLDHGGHCEGVVYRVPGPYVKETRAYLHRRENITNTYIAGMKPVKLLDGSHRTLLALCYIVNRRHPQYAGDLPIDRQAYLVRRSIGASGDNLDYVVSTVEHLRELGVHDDRLEVLMAKLGHGLPKAKMPRPDPLNK
jgi:cation transport protein ChaC